MRNRHRVNILVTNTPGAATQPATRWNREAVGGALDPFSSFLTLRGIRILSLRVEKHSANALAIAQWLALRLANGIAPQPICLSVGIEDANNLIVDLQQALEKRAKNGGRCACRHKMTLGLNALITNLCESAQIVFETLFPFSFLR